jgi:predicted permease
MGMSADIRLAWRLLSRARAVAALAILSMALGTGAASVVFAAIKAVLIEPLPYSHPETLVQIRTDYPGEGNPRQDWVSWLDMRDVARENHSFSALATYHYAIFNLGSAGSALPEAAYGLRVSAELFPMLGVRPMLGRNILPEETQPGREHEMILSYGLWVRRFHADPGSVGRDVLVNGYECRIIGVMPEGFDFPLRLATSVSTPSRHMDFWAPAAVDPAKARREAADGGAVARLRPGVSLHQARQDLAAIAGRLARIYPASNRRRTLNAVYLKDRALGFARTGLLLLLGAAAVFLLIVCANLANLLLARALARHREIAVRAALGAGRGRIVRQLITESVVLAIFGGLGGYVGAAAAWAVLPALTPMSIPRLAAARADWAVFAFALALSGLSGIVAALAPAWRLSRQALAGALRQSGAPVLSLRSRVRTILLISEVATTVVLVVIGGSLAGGFVRLLSTDPGFAPDRVLASIIVPAGDRYENHPENRAVLFRRILEGVRRLPGVEAAGAVDALPFSGENNGAYVAATEEALTRPDIQPTAELDRVSPGYLEAMGVRLHEGRGFREEDLEAHREVAIVNDLAAQRFWPGGSAVGKRICLMCTPGRPADWRRIIGVVSSIRHAALDQPPGLQVYISEDALANAVFVVTRTSRPGAGLARQVRRAVASADPNQPVFLSATMARLIGDSVSDRRFVLLLLGITACLALLLSAAGIYGVVSYVTARRTQEIGVRMALGAAPRQVRSLVFRQGMGMTAAGIGIGLPASLALLRPLRHIIVGVRAADPALAALAVGLVAATAALACWIPARRATRIDPMTALREE